jgi:hypothetical protein
MADWRRQILPALFAAVLGACSQLPPPGSGTAVGNGANEVREHQSGEFIVLVGPTAQHAAPFLGIPGTNFFRLRSFIDRRNGQSADQLYVSDSYSGPERNWDAAHDASGHPLVFIPISRQEITCSSGCSYAEEFAVNLPERELRANPDGLNVIFTDPTGGEQTVTVSAAQIAAQLEAVETQRRAVLRAVAGSVETPLPAAAHQAE